MMKKILIALVVIAAGLYWFTHRATSVNSTDAPGFKPLRDDALAQKYRPYLLASEFGKPQALYYRASRSGEKLYITYHYVWDREVNNAEGWKPWLSRNLYTGGLALQRTMFGKGDIEMVSLVINGEGKVESVVYETALGHSPSDFSVKHETIRTARPATPLVFKVISWNHLFLLQEKPPDPSAWLDLDVEYFTQPLWEEYEMFKEKETVLKRNRAHEIYERAPAH